MTTTKDILSDINLLVELQGKLFPLRARLEKIGYAPTKSLAAVLSEINNTLTGMYEVLGRYYAADERITAESSLQPNPMKAWGADRTEQTFQP